MTNGVLIVDAQIDGVATECRVVDGRVAELGVGLERASADRVVDAVGGALLPGLVDHHLHLFSAAAARTSVDASGVSDPQELAVPPGRGWLRIIGVGRDWSRDELDAAFGVRPVRVQHRSGALWTLNRAAVDRLASGLDETERRTGRLWRDDARLRRLLADDGEGTAVDLPALGDELLRLGITHVTDATPDLDEAGLAALRTALPQRVDSLSTRVDSHLPCKVVVADHELPSLDELADAIQSARERRRAVAVHAVTAAALALTIAALDLIGAAPGDRVEHAAVCDDGAADRLAELGVVVVTQPTLWRRRRAEFLAETSESDRRLLWRHGSLLARGVAVGVGSDAPYGSFDPWQQVQAAASRESPEAVDAATTVRSLLADPATPAGPPRRIVVGDRADLVLLDTPLDRALAKAAVTGRSPVARVFLGHKSVAGPAAGSAD